VAFSIILHDMWQFPFSMFANLYYYSTLYTITDCYRFVSVSVFGTIYYLAHKSMYTHCSYINFKQLVMGKLVSLK